jgi:hypothetical protein
MAVRPDAVDWIYKTVKAARLAKSQVLRRMLSAVTVIL